MYNNTNTNTNELTGFHMGSGPTGFSQRGHKSPKCSANTHIHTYIHTRGFHRGATNPLTQIPKRFCKEPTRASRIAICCFECVHVGACCQRVPMRVGHEDFLLHSCDDLYRCTLGITTGCIYIYI